MLWVDNRFSLCCPATHIPWRYQGWANSRAQKIWYKQNCSSLDIPGYPYNWLSAARLRWGQNEHWIFWNEIDGQNLPLGLTRMGSMACWYWAEHPRIWRTLLEAPQGVTNDCCCIHINNFRSWDQLNLLREGLSRRTVEPPTSVVFGDQKNFLNSKSISQVQFETSVLNSYQRSTVSGSQKTEYLMSR